MSARDQGFKSQLASVIAAALKDTLTGDEREKVKQRIRERAATWPDPNSTLMAHAEGFGKLLQDPAETSPPPAVAVIPPSPPPPSEVEFDLFLEGHADGFPPKPTFKGFLQEQVNEWVAYYEVNWRKSGKPYAKMLEFGGQKFLVCGTLTRIFPSGVKIGSVTVTEDTIITMKATTEGLRSLREGDESVVVVVDGDRGCASYERTTPDGITEKFFVWAVAYKENREVRWWVNRASNTMKEDLLRHVARMAKGSFTLNETWRKSRPAAA